MYKENPRRLSVNFSAKTLQARNKWHDILKMLKGKKYTTKNNLSGKLSFRIEEEIKSY